MSTTHVTKLLCPICSITFLEHVHCANQGCSFTVTTCPQCDRKQAVEAFVNEHESDCECAKPLATGPFARVA